MEDAEFVKLRKKALGFLVRDGYLFKKGKRRGATPRRVVGTAEQRRQIMHELHDTHHRGRQATFEHVSRRYQWKGMWDDVTEFVKSCDECQRRSSRRYEEPLHPTWSCTVWEKVGVDVVYMPLSEEGFSFLVFARDDLSGWVEGRAIVRANSMSVAKFIYEDVICRHGCPRSIVIDNGPENQGVTEDLLNYYRIKNLRISSYHPQSNALVERGHADFVNALSKFCAGKSGVAKWPKYVPLALWADRVSVRRTTGYSAFQLVYGRDCLLPVDFIVASWSVVDWEAEVRSREDLLLARMKQLDERVLAESWATAELERSRRINKSYFDNAKRMRPKEQQLKVGDLVLLHNSAKTSGMRQTKLDFNWLGPYRIREASPAGYYRLEELDGAQLMESFAGNRLKRFFSRRSLINDQLPFGGRGPGAVGAVESEEEEEEEEEEAEEGVLHD